MACGFLISVCNAKIPFAPYSLAYYRFSDASLHLVKMDDVPHIARRLTGVIGMTWHNGLFYVGLQGGGSDGAVAVFDGALRYQTTLTLPGVRDIHGVKSINGRLLAVSSGTNQIFTVDTNNGATSLFWESPLENDQDRIHLNDYAEFEGRRLILTHSSFAEPDRKNGMVFDIDRNEVLVEGMLRPHTLFEKDGQLLVCDSHRHRIMRAAGGEVGAVCTLENRFLRGAAAIGDQTIVGCSGLRIFSRSKGFSKRYADENPIGHERYMSWLYFLDANYAIRKIIPYSPLGFEPYDILPVLQEPAGEVLVPDPATVRIQAYAHRQSELEMRTQELAAGTPESAAESLPETAAQAAPRPAVAAVSAARLAARMERRRLRKLAENTASDPES